MNIKAPMRRTVEFGENMSLDEMWPVAAERDEARALLEAHALIEEFNMGLLRAKTATAALEKWCVDHKLATDTTIRARILDVAAKPISAEQRGRLRISEVEPVKYRRVELTCGKYVLSEADNWYVPGRLTAAMNHILTTTDTPFGRAVEDLKPVRKAFMVEFLWLGSPDGSAPDEQVQVDAPRSVLAPPRLALRHRALVFAANDEPLAEVQETYTKDLLGL